MSLCCFFASVLSREHRVVLSWRDLGFKIFLGGFLVRGGLRSGGVVCLEALGNICLRGERATLPSKNTPQLGRFAVCCGSCLGFGEMRGCRCVAFLPLFFRACTG